MIVSRTEHRLWGTLFRRGFPVEIVVSQIEKFHHEYLRRELPGLAHLFEETRGTESSEGSEEMLVAFQKLRECLERTVHHEKTCLFPLLRNIGDGTDISGAQRNRFHRAIRVFIRKQETVDRANNELRRSIDDFSSSGRASGLFRRQTWALRSLSLHLISELEFEADIVLPMLVGIEEKVLRLQLA